MTQRDVLQGFYEEPLPPPGVDIRRAMRAGRRRNRVRASVTAVGVAALIAAGAVTAPQWRHMIPSPSGGGLTPSTAEQPTCPSAGPLATVAPSTPPAGQAPPEFDLLRHWVAVEGVTGLRLTEYSTARYWQQVQLADASGRTLVDIELYARGGQPVFPAQPATAPEPVDPTTGTATDPVGGHPAYWLPGRQGLYQYEVARLGWQWAEDAWVFVAAADTTMNGEAPKSGEQVNQLRAVARDVADALHIGAASPVKAPFTVRVPDCTRLMGTVVLRSAKSDGTPFTRVTLTFGHEGDDGHNPMLSRSGPTSSVTADSGATPQDKPGSADAVIDGHPAAQMGSGLVLYGVDGFALEIVTPGGDDAVLAFARSVRIVPGAPDESAWTVAPLTYGPQSSAAPDRGP